MNCASCGGVVALSRQRESLNSRNRALKFGVLLYLGTRIGPRSHVSLVYMMFPRGPYFRVSRGQPYRAIRCTFDLVEN